MDRIDGRKSDEIRKVNVTKDFIKHAEGSVLFEMGDTKVICNATVNEFVPFYKKGSGQGWITAEYSMLPRATAHRNQRDIANLKLSGRTAEIQRLIGRALRGAVDLSLLGERTVVLDCDVIQADGGTRTASITGAFIALQLAMQKLLISGTITKNPILHNVAAVSVGKVNGEILVDLCYAEDSTADVDMNVVLNSQGEFIEIQGTGEGTTFSQDELSDMLEIAKKSIGKLFEIQNEVLECLIN